MDWVGFTASSVVSLILGIFISSYFAQRRSVHWMCTRRKILDPVGGRVPEGVQVLFNGVEVSGLCEWKIGIWNGGNTAVSQEDYLTEFPLKLSFNTEKIIKVSTPLSRRAVVNVDTHLDGECSMLLKPNLLDKGDWVVFNIYTQMTEVDLRSINKELDLAVFIRNVSDGSKRVVGPIIEGVWDYVLTLAMIAAYSFFGWSVFAKLRERFSTGEVGPLYNDLVKYIGEEYSLYTYWFFTGIVVVIGIAICLILLFLVLIMIFSMISRPPLEVRDLIVEQSDRTIVRRIAKRRFGIS